MSRIWNWLWQKPRHWWGYLTIPLGSALSLFGYIFFAAFVIVTWLKIPTSSFSQTTLNLSAIQPQSLVLLVIKEEIIYRAIPWLVVAILSPLLPQDKLPHLVAQFTGAIKFGLVHGSWINIFIQGVYGLIFSLVFLKCGGNSNRPGRGLFSSALTHFLVNAGLLVLTG